MRYVSAISNGMLITRYPPKSDHVSIEDNLDAYLGLALPIIGFDGPTIEKIVATVKNEDFYKGIARWDGTFEYLLVLDESIDITHREGHGIDIGLKRDENAGIPLLIEFHPELDNPKAIVCVYDPRDDPYVDKSVIVGEDVSVGAAIAALTRELSFVYDVMYEVADDASEFAVWNVLRGVNVSSEINVIAPHRVNVRSYGMRVGCIQESADDQDNSVG